MKKSEDIRILTGITREEMAEVLNVSLRQLLSFEKGEVVLPEESQMLLTTLDRYLNTLHRKYMNNIFDDTLPTVEKLQELLYRNRKAQQLLEQKVVVAKQKFFEKRGGFYKHYRGSNDSRNLKLIIALASEKNIHRKRAAGYSIEYRLMKYEEKLLQCNLDHALIRAKRAA
jgi:transcriptional regulator with XRE-family HTH domain